VGKRGGRLKNKKKSAASLLVKGKNRQGGERKPRGVKRKISRVQKKKQTPPACSRVDVVGKKMRKEYKSRRRAKK